MTSALEYRPNADTNTLNKTIMFPLTPEQLPSADILLQIISS